MLPGAEISVSFAIMLAQYAGVRFMVVLQPGPGGFTDMSRATYWFGQIDPNTVDYGEGPNELDNNASVWGGSIPAMGPNGRAFEAAKRVWRDTNADARIRRILLTSATVTSHAGALSIGDLSQYNEFVTIHPYQLPVEPGAGLAAAEANLIAINALGRPWIVSEEGYQDGVAVTTPSFFVNTEVSALVQDKYLLRMFAENFLQGVPLTTMYDWTNDGTDPHDGEENFGFLNNDGTYKESALSLKNLIAIVQETPYAFPSEVIGNGDLISETFVKPDQTGLGVAPSGSDTNKNWRDGDGNNNQWRVVGGHAETTTTFQVRMVGGDSHNAGQAVEVAFSHLVPGASQECRVGLRYTDFNNTYWCNVNPNQSNEIILFKNVGGVTTTLNFTPKASLATATAITVKLMILVIGNDNHLFCKAYATPDGEPVDYDLVFVDVGAKLTILGSGFGAFWANDISTGQHMHIDSVLFSSVSPTAGVRPALLPFTLGQLDYTLTGMPSTGKRILLQKRSGTFYLMLWDRISSWNSTTKADIVNTPTPVTLTLNGLTGLTASYFQPRLSAVGTSLGVAALFTADFNAAFQHATPTGSFSQAFSAAFARAATNSVFTFNLLDEVTLVRLA